jgi:hypothetical protein
MIFLVEVRKELEAIRSSDALFVANEYTKDCSELIEFIVRQCRKRELLELMRTISPKN